MLLCIILGVTGSGILSESIEYYFRVLLNWKIGTLEFITVILPDSHWFFFICVLFQIMVQHWDRVLVPTQKKICITMSLSSTELGPPPRWRVVTSGWIQDCWSTALLPHQQPIRKKSHILKPSSQVLPLFLGTSDDHPVRSPVWLLSISSLRGANGFKLNCCYYKGECWFQAHNTST